MDRVAELMHKIRENEAEQERLLSYQAQRKTERDRTRERKRRNYERLKEDPVKYEEVKAKAGKRVKDCREAQKEERMNRILADPVKTARWQAYKAEHGDAH